jgi:carboxyl-terminal processing protease
LRPNDRIEAIDGHRTRGQSMQVNGRRLRGEPGTQVVLTIRRGGKAPFDVPITRALIRIDPIVAEALPHDLALIRIRTFQRNTAERLDEAIARLQPKGIILDLRNNPGGLVRAAVDVADRFLDGGAVVSSRGRAENRTWSAHPGTFTDAPIAVLVNSGTASAAEIVAGALQDRKRAQLLGTPTFGKGSIQTLFRLSDGSGVKLTIARYHLPSGRAIQAEGLDPDIPLDPPADDAARVRERDLPGRLDGAKVDTARPVREKTSMPAPSTSTPVADPWIARAIEVLRP